MALNLLRSVTDILLSCVEVWPNARNVMMNVIFRTRVK